MPPAVKHESSRAHSAESSFVSLLSGWAQQGVQSFFATQRILLDLAMRQNASVMHAIRQQLSDPHHSPTALLSEMTGEGMANFIEGQKVLLDLGQQQNTPEDNYRINILYCQGLGAGILHLYRST